MEYFCKVSSTFIMFSDFHFQRIKKQAAEKEDNINRSTWYSVYMHSAHLKFENNLLHRDKSVFFSGLTFCLRAKACN